jgi:phage/plasmid-associated DNA primase
VVRQGIIAFYEAEAQRRADTDRLKRISGMLSANRIRAILWVARLCVTIEGEAFDTDPDLLNVRNGVLDLRSGILRPHDPSLMLTKVTMVDYRPGATHQDWDKALASHAAGSVEILMCAVWSTTSWTGTGSPSSWRVEASYAGSLTPTSSACWSGSTRAVTRGT